MVEQSSTDVWRAVSAAVKEAVARAAVAPADIGGIGFDATCSLVVLGDEGAPLPVGLSGDAERDIIVWMDHRAVGQAERSEEHTSELQSLMRISYAVFCLKKKKKNKTQTHNNDRHT